MLLKFDQQRNCASGDLRYSKYLQTSTLDIYIFLNYLFKSRQAPLRASIFLENAKGVIGSIGKVSGKQISSDALSSGFPSELELRSHIDILQR